jgi:hypothetical protein
MKIIISLFVCICNCYAQKIDFTFEVRPLLAKKCFSCHGPAKSKGKLRLDTLQGINKVSKTDKLGFIEIIERITSEDKDEIMPPHKTGASLSTKEKNILINWVKQGAESEDHWAFQPLAKPKLPKNEKTQVIDKYIFAKLKTLNLNPSPEASKRKLIRRLSLDVRGLTPSIEEIQMFRNDKSPNAYQNLIDRFLESPLYGEKWASKWLDLARYADTRGYEKDKHRVIWQYRDWVIEALNDDLPYDEFSIMQLAGDMFKNPTQNNIVATAFHRNTMTNDEGGTDDEEFRTEAVKDRTDTTSMIWLGISMSCAKCHSHKYDPISQAEYYSFYAYFNQTEDKDDDKDSPLINVIDLKEQNKLKNIKIEIDKLNAEREKLFKNKDTEIAYVKWKKTQNSKNLKKKFFKQDVELRKMTSIIKQKESLKNKYSKTNLPIMKERPLKNHRENYIHERGFFLNKGKKVSPSTPAFLHQTKNGTPQDRLSFAQWLLDKKNPLAARVAVNRIWAQIFGRGIVETEENFGSQGSIPTNPQLLNWLAIDFMEQGWSQKKLIKTILLSETYKQSSVVSANMIRLDPHNLYLARGPRFRMTAEMIRDSALKIAGLLSNKMYGPSVMPYQPPGLWKTTYNHVEWKLSKGEDKYRRGLYTYLKRTSPYPTKINFDASSREICTVRRIRSNTPLQALNTLNDPVYVEAAQAFARNLLSKEKTTTDRIQLAYETALSRKADKKEVLTIEALLTTQLYYYQKHKSEASSMAENPHGPLDKKLNIAEAAAWSTICNVILNLDEFLTKE